MINWLKANEQTRRRAIDQISFETGFSPSAIEKDWYVTLALKAVYQTSWAGDIVFKGGTSLSKGWQLITRFSEDIDLAINPSALGFTGTLEKRDVKKLRKKSASYMGGEFLGALTAQLRSIDITTDMLTIHLQQIDSSDTDPRIIELEYPTLYPTQDYVRSKVLLEVGARSLREPFTMRPITSLVTEYLPNTPFAVPAFDVPTVNPGRTMLEKMFLLHEEFTKPAAKIRHQRMSRHLYDIDSLMKSTYGPAALKDIQLFETIRTHRSVFNPHPHIDYTTTQLHELIIIPPQEAIDKWEQDYAVMRISMLGANPPEFSELIHNLTAITDSLKVNRSE